MPGALSRHRRRESASLRLHPSAASPTHDAWSERSRALVASWTVAGSAVVAVVALAVWSRGPAAGLAATLIVGYVAAMLRGRPNPTASTGVDHPRLDALAASVLAIVFLLVLLPEWSVALAAGSTVVCVAGFARLATWR